MFLTRFSDKSFWSFLLFSGDISLFLVITEDLTKVIDSIVSSSLVKSIS